MKLTTNEKIRIVNKYLSGYPATSLCIEKNISRSTLYNWISHFKEVPINKAILVRINYIKTKEITHAIDIP